MRGICWLAEHYYLLKVYAPCNYYLWHCGQMQAMAS